MKDPADNQTLELISTPKKRGRPSTGKALSPAQRKRAQRDRDRNSFLSRPDDLEEATLDALFDLLRRAVRVGWPDKVAEISAELIRRAKENDE